VHTYAAYGLGIRSAIELPELGPGRGPADVVIRLGAVGDPDPGSAPGDGVVHATAAEVILRWSVAGTFRLQAGREITVEPRPGGDPAALRAHLLGPALALLLHQRGFLVLHASGAAVAGGAVLFLGSSGRGKSTAVAALHARGHPVVADDVVAVDLARGGIPAVPPGVPHLRLWPDVLASLGETPGRLPIGAKRGVRPLGGGAGGPRPLRRLYVLDDAEDFHVEPLEGHAAVFALVEHAYIAPVLGRLGSAAHLAQCARLATAVPVRRLLRPRSLARLAELAAVVEADARDADGGWSPGPAAAGGRG
jgi:hypothetical protein